MKLIRLASFSTSIKSEQSVSGLRMIAGQTSGVQMAEPYMIALTHGAGSAKRESDWALSHA